MPYEIDIPALNRILDFNGGNRELSAAAADGLTDYLKAYLYRLDIDRPNQLGGERSHFYRSAEEGITHEIREDGADIIINQTGFRQRLLGGDIHAKNSKYLTIPAIAEAYGHRAREFDLRFIMFKSGSKALVGKGEDRRVYYWLVESVHQDGDPTVLPDNDAMAQAVINSVDAYLNGVILSKQTGSIYQDADFIKSTDKY